jgi:hypothetical protein
VQPESPNDKALVQTNGSLTPHASSATASADTDRGQQTSESDRAELLRFFFPARTNSSSPRMQSEQHQENRQGEGQSMTTIAVNGNRALDADVVAYNNTFRPNSSFKGELIDNDVCGGIVKIGNEEPYRSGNKSNQK